MTYGLKEIAKDLLSGKLPASANVDLSVARMAVCKECQEFAHVTHQCKLCGCFMDIKVTLLNATCPASKW